MPLQHRLRRQLIYLVIVRDFQSSRRLDERATKSQPHFVCTKIHNLDALAPTNQRLATPKTLFTCNLNIVVVIIAELSTKVNYTRTNRKGKHHIFIVGFFLFVFNNFVLDCQPTAFIIIQLRDPPVASESSSTSWHFHIGPIDCHPLIYCACVHNTDTKSHPYYHFIKHRVFYTYLFSVRSSPSIAAASAYHQPCHHIRLLVRQPISFDGEYMDGS